MKKFLFVFALTLFSLPIFAQEETLFDGSMESNGFGAPVLKVTEIDKSTNLLIGGRGGWILNHTFVLGGGGYGLVTDISLIDQSGRHLRLAMGYGGAEFEYIYNSNKFIHFTVQALIGGGGVSWYEERNRDYWNDNMPTEWYSSDAFFIFEPGLNVELNFTKWMRIDIGGSYRMITGADSKLTYNGNMQKSMGNKELSGFSGNITFKFGSF